MWRSYKKNQWLSSCKQRSFFITFFCLKISKKVREGKKAIGSIGGFWRCSFCSATTTVSYTVSSFWPREGSWQIEQGAAEFGKRNGRERKERRTRVRRRGRERKIEGNANKIRRKRTDEPTQGSKGRRKQKQTSWRLASWLAKLPAPHSFFPSSIDRSGCFDCSSNQRLLLPLS